MADTVEFTIVTPDEWQQIPAPPPPKKKDRFEQLLEAVAKGSIVKLETTDNKNLKGTRIAIARAARAKGFVVDFKNIDTILYVQKSEKPLEPKPEKQKPKEKESVPKKTGRE